MTKYCDRQYCDLLVYKNVGGGGFLIIKTNRNVPIKIVKFLKSKLIIILSRPLLLIAVRIILT